MVVKQEDPGTCSIQKGSYGKLHRSGQQLTKMSLGFLENCEQAVSVMTAWVLVPSSSVQLTSPQLSSRGSQGSEQARW